MPGVFRFAIGAVGLGGALILVWVATALGDAAPRGQTPIYLLAVFFGLVAACAFWPRKRARVLFDFDPPDAAIDRDCSSRDQGYRPLESLWTAATRARKFGVYFITVGSLCALLLPLGLARPQWGQVGRVPPVVIGSAGLVMLIMGGVSFMVSFDERASRTTIGITRGALWIVLAALVLLPFAAVAYVLLE